MLRRDLGMEFQVLFSLAPVLLLSSLHWMSIVQTKPNQTKTQIMFSSQLVSNDFECTVHIVWLKLWCWEQLSVNEVMEAIYARSSLHDVRLLLLQLSPVLSRARPARSRRRKLTGLLGRARVLAWRRRGGCK